MAPAGTRVTLRARQEAESRPVELDCCGPRRRCCPVPYEAPALDGTWSPRCCTARTAGEPPSPHPIAARFARRHCGRAGSDFRHTVNLHPLPSQRRAARTIRAVDLARDHCRRADRGIPRMSQNVPDATGARTHATRAYAIPPGAARPVRRRTIGANGNERLQESERLTPRISFSTTSLSDRRWFRISETARSASRAMIASMICACSPIEISVRP